MTWRITLTSGATFTCQAGELEGTLRSMRHRYGSDEFAVEAEAEDPGVYVPELVRPEVPDTLPEEWTSDAAS